MIYPADLACPLIADYKSTIDFDGAIVEFENGNRRQRRRWSSVGVRVTLGFAVGWNKLFDWQLWVNRHAYDWFKMGLYSHHSAINFGKMIPSEIRFVSDMKVTALNNLYAKVVVDAEFNPEYMPFIPATFSDTWVIAGTPELPAPDDVIVALEENPDGRHLIAGTPDEPAA